MRWECSALRGRHQLDARLHRASHLLYATSHQNWRTNKTVTDGKLQSALTTWGISRENNTALLVIVSGREWPLVAEFYRVYCFANFYVWNVRLWNVEKQTTRHHIFNVQCVNLFQLKCHANIFYYTDSL